MLKWYWWRFNAYGYFWGMVAGIAAAGIVSQSMTWIFGAGAFGEAAPVYGFPFILGISLVGCIAGSLLTPPDDRAVLKKFYYTVRPWGFWRPIHDELLQEHPNLMANKDFGRDMFNVLVGIAWQTALVAAGIYIVVQNWTALAICAGHHPSDHGSAQVQLAATSWRIIRPTSSRNVGLWLRTAP